MSNVEKVIQADNEGRLKGIGYQADSFMRDVIYAKILKREQKETFAVLRDSEGAVGSLSLPAHKECEFIELSNSEREEIETYLKAKNSLLISDTDAKARRVKDTLQTAFMMGAKVEVARYSGDILNDSHTIVINWLDSSIQAIKMTKEEREVFLSLI